MVKKINRKDQKQTHKSDKLNKKERNDLNQLQQLLFITKYKNKQAQIYINSDSEVDVKEEAIEVQNASLIKIPPSQSSSSLQLSQQASYNSLSQQDSGIKLSIIEQSVKSNTPILHSTFFESVDEVDFQFYVTALSRSRIYGSMLVDSLGRVLWCDKLAHQIFEASLNNFDKMRIQNLLLQSELESFLQKLRSLNYSNQNCIVKWVIYSKNLKRKYLTYPLPSNPSSQDLFYRYLKCVSVRIRPISIKLHQFRDYFGYSNEYLLSKQKQNQCFFLEIRTAKRLPKFEHLHIFSDRIIRKFLFSTRLKGLMKEQSLQQVQQNVPEVKKEVKEDNHSDVKKQTCISGIKIRQGIGKVRKQYQKRQKMNNWGKTVRQKVQKK